MNGFVDCYYSSHPQPRTTITPYDRKLPQLVLLPGNYFVKRIDGDKLSNRTLYNFEVDTLLKYEKPTDQKLKDFRETQSKWQVVSPPHDSNNFI